MIGYLNFYLKQNVLYNIIFLGLWYCNRPIIAVIQPDFLRKFLIAWISTVLQYIPVTSFVGA